MRIFRLFVFAILSLLFAQQHATATDLQIEVRFSSNEISIIRDYYESSNVSKSRGKKSAKELPPGIAKNLARGKPLPPGIAKQLLPGDLLTELPPVADGYERIIVAGKILLVEVATQIVRDILTDVVFN